jgi:ABC-2 type transport system ATP-binding protein
MQEAEAVCDRIIIINNGKIMADELKNNIHSVIKRHRQSIKIEFDKKPDASEILKIAGVMIAKPLTGNLWLIEAEGEEDIRPAIFSFSVRNNLTVLFLQKEESNLEEVFRHLTSG